MRTYTRASAVLSVHAPQEAVIRGYKGATLYASPGGAELEGLEGAAVVDFALGG